VLTRVELKRGPTDRPYYGLKRNPEKIKSEHWDTKKGITGEIEVPPNLQNVGGLAKQEGWSLT